jgi:hypothetical protein
MLLAGTAQHVGHLLPPLAIAPAEWVMQLHLRTLTLGERVAGWAVAVAQRQPVADTGLFVSMLSLLAWGSAAWLAWWLVRRRDALAATLPAGVLLAVNVHLSGQPWLMWCAYLVLAAGLAIYLNYRRQHVDWDQRQIDYPEQLGLEWATASVLLAGGIGLAGVLGPLVGTSTSWRLLAEFAARSRAEVGQTAGDLFSGVKPPQPGGTPLAPAAVAWTPDLSRIGGPMDQSPSTIMWVTPGRAPAPTFPGAPPPPQHYWRAGLVCHLHRAGLAAAGREPAPAPAATTKPGRYALAQHLSNRGRAWPAALRGEPAHLQHRCRGSDFGPAA